MGFRVYYEHDAEFYSHGKVLLVTVSTFGLQSPGPWIIFLVVVEHVTSSLFGVLCLIPR